ncbi:sensor histidine kinase [Flavisolibacter ginsengisoli]|jgi:signal transduction histidine kinase|uniref:histidine kinase n=1 Tax=Flavisolibacter ginsengisoli DSM 18119 TaxID=1121884 RepID=A0A1M4SUN6_9BACT|nr:HAMP domain-containing sensor histidine kinase [Flavisolibacter ginsengisoli]SHE35909.1 Histidine kinase-, DNA gyrase B-, and HSP90-like ATPase [Flavisolibacter ginsengisoli DSM 18119]
MIFKDFQWRILSRVLLLVITLTAASFFLVKQWHVYLALISPLVIYQIIEFLRFQKKTYDEVNQFVEAVHYRDFSRYFDVKHASADIQPLRKGFNEINSTFKVISKEKETQYQYLQKILELVGTGILSYEMETGEVVWMNESLKNMLQLPYLKTIHSFEKRDSMLFTEIYELRPGESKIAIAHLEKSHFKILLSATAFQTEGKKFKLVAFQNVNEALDETESRAWQKLLSVMTHEIMNSVAPISSLAETLKKRLTSTDTNTLEDLELGIETIQRRSEGLLKFAETYRNLNKITKLNLQKVYIRELFGNLHQLMAPTFEQKGIELEIILKDTDLMLEADPSLIEQVLINLIVNAIEAVKDQLEPRIILSAEQPLNKKVILKVADNGPGIPEEVLDKIFIPFFSTKKSGSGIGLSLCKQIIMLHRGNIQVQSIEGKGTVFSMQF